MQGRAAADALCAADAARSGYAAPFVALLGTEAESALARLVDPGRPWVRPDGMVVAESIADAVSQGLRTPIAMLADGTYLAGQSLLGAPDLAQPLAFHCENWTDAQATPPAVIQGIAGYTDARWHAATTSACSEPARVICVER